MAYSAKSGTAVPDHLTDHEITKRSEATTSQCPHCVDAREGMSQKMSLWHYGSISIPVD